MGYDGTGRIYVPLEELWGFVKQYMPKVDGEIAFGVPKVEGGDLVVDYAHSTECNPKDWATKPEAVTQWEAQNKKTA